MRATIACTPARGTARGALVGIHADLVAAVLIEGPDADANQAALDAAVAVFRRIRTPTRDGVHRAYWAAREGGLRPLERIVLAVLDRNGGYRLGPAPAEHAYKIKDGTTISTDGCRYSWVARQVGAPRMDAHEIIRQHAAMGPERPAIAIVLDATASDLMRSGVHLPEEVT